MSDAIFLNAAARDAHQGLPPAELTKRIQIRAERLGRMVDLGVPAMIIAQGCELLRHAVDELERQSHADLAERATAIGRAKPSQFDPIAIDQATSADCKHFGGGLA